MQKGFWDVLGISEEGKVAFLLFWLEEIFLP